MLSRVGQCGPDSAKTYISAVDAVASMDRHANYSHVDLGESIMYSAATLQLYGLPQEAKTMPPPRHWNPR